MKFPPFVHRWLHKLNLSLGLLIVLLQRTPVVRVAVTAAEFVLASPAGNILKSSLATAAALGAVNSMAGATELSTSTPSPAQLTVGVNASIVFAVIGTIGDATSWSVSGSVPPGLTFQGGRTTGTINAGILTLSGAPTTAGNYSISLVGRYDPLGINSPTFNYSFNVTGAANVAPNITTQPQSHTVTAGANVSFTGGANGTPAPTLQWRKNGNDIGGATGTTLTLNNVQAGDAGNYTLVATNTEGTATSNAATLTVNAAPSAPAFTVHPAGQTVIAGNNVTFFSAADGNPAPTYQWRFNGADIGGATNSTLTLFNVQAGNAGSYAVVATNGSGSVMSNPATLTVNPATLPPSFTTQPVSQTAIVGKMITLTAVATGIPAPTFQWQKDGVDVAGANAASLSFNPVRLGDAGTYRVVATNSVASIPSVHAVLTVVNPFAFADFDGNGQSDLIWQNRVTGERYVYLMNGTSVVSATSLGVLPPEWMIAATGDFNGDGKTDLVWQNTITGERYVYLMNGTTVITGVSIASLPPAWSIAATADFNGDGKPDLVWQNTVTGERYVYLMDGTNFLAGLSLGTVAPIWSIAGVADFNGDGQPDLLWQNTATGEEYVWLLNGTSYSAGVSLGTEYYMQISGVGDYNADGKPDILLTNTVTGERFVRLMNGTTPISTVSLGTIGLEWILNRPGPRRMSADFDVDGRSDLVWQNTTTGEGYVYLMNGTNVSSGLSLSLGTTAQWQIAATADFNADGHPDLVAQNTVTGERVIWLMNVGSIASTVSLGTLSTQWTVAIAADLNADGNPDIVWQNTATGERYIYLMNGTTVSSGQSLNLGVNGQWTIAATADFNADGKPDLVGQNLTTGERCIWLMNGSTVTSTVSLGTVAPAWTIAVAADLNVDGKPDLIWQNLTTGERYIYLMDGTTISSGVSLDTVASEWVIQR